MKRAGQSVLVPFPFTDLSGSKLRPVLMVRQTSHRYDDWLGRTWMKFSIRPKLLRTSQ